MFNAGFKLSSRNLAIGKTIPGDKGENGQSTGKENQWPLPTLDKPLDFFFFFDRCFMLHSNILHLFDSTQHYGGRKPATAHEGLTRHCTALVH